MKRKLHIVLRDLINSYGNESLNDTRLWALLLDSHCEDVSLYSKIIRDYLKMKYGVHMNKIIHEKDWQRLIIEQADEFIGKTGYDKIRVAIIVQCFLYGIGKVNVNDDVYQTREDDLWHYILDGKKITDIKRTERVRSIFYASKEYSYPQLPIELSWDISKANEVELVGFGKVPLKSSCVVTPVKDTMYELKVKDSFGEHVERLTVHMLPLPFIKTVMAPAPQMINTLNIEIKQPKIDIQLNIPQIKIQSVDLKMPFVKSLKELNTDVKLKCFTIERLDPWTRVENLFDKYFNHK